MSTIVQHFQVMSTFTSQRDPASAAVHRASQPSFDRVACGRADDSIHGARASRVFDLSACGPQGVSVTSRKSRRALLRAKSHLLLGVLSGSSILTPPASVGPVSVDAVDAAAAVSVDAVDAAAACAPPASVGTVSVDAAAASAPPASVGTVSVAAADASAPAVSVGPVCGCPPAPHGVCPVRGCPPDPLGAGPVRRGRFFDPPVRAGFG